MWNKGIFSIKTKSLELKLGDNFNETKIGQFEFISETTYGDGYLIYNESTKEIGFIPSKEVILIAFCYKELV